MPVGQVSLAIRPAGIEDERSWQPWRRAELFILLGYLLLALVLTWHINVDPASRVPSNGNPAVESDISLNIWFMRYAATAVSHGHLPALITTAVNAPHGINLMWNTSMLLPGIVLAPVTLLWGPAASLAVLLVLGFAGSAAALYFVLRRWGVSIAGAAIGGAVYGFSPALLVSAEDHYHLQFAVLPPLIVDAVLRLAVGRGNVLRVGAWLGLLVAAQIFIAEELLVDTALALVILLAVLALSRPAEIAERLPRTVGGAAIALGVTLLLCLHALLVQFRGPLTETGSPWHLGHYWIDPLDFVTAPNAVLLHGHFRHFIIATRQWPVETMAYLGWPLLILVIAAMIAFWRDLRIRIAGVAFLLMEWMGIGNHRIVVHGVHYPTALLPWHWLVRIPVLNQVLPNRFPILADGLAAVVLVCALDRVLAAIPERNAWRIPAAAGVVALILLPIVPRPVPAIKVLQPPAGWHATLDKLHLRTGASVLVLPFNAAIATRANPMEWQALAGSPISLVGGYCIVPDQQGRAVMCNTRSTLTRAQHASVLRMTWLGLNKAGRRGPASATMAAAISAWHPAAVVTAQNPDSRLGRYLIRYFGTPTVHEGAMMGWRLPPSPVADTPAAATR